MRKLGAIVTLLALGLAPAPGRVEPSRLQAGYAVHWAGLPVADLSVGAAFGDGVYSIVASGRSVGVLALFVDVTSEAAALGARLVGGGVRPSRFRQSSDWNGRAQTARVEFAPGGEAVTVDVSESRELAREPVPADLQRGPDPLSAVLLAALQAAPATSLAAATFDGRRALALGLTCGAVEPVAPPAAAPWLATALRCEATAQLTAGGLAERRERRLRLEGPVTVWLATELPAGLAVPIRIEVATSLGRVVAELVRLGPDGS